jgi:predicted DNA-binding protein with PD1-like motif
MFTYEGKERRVVVVRFEPEDDLLVGLGNAVAQLGIRHGAIVGGIGAVKSYGLHVVKSTAIPPGNVFFWEDNLPYDIVNVTGYVMDGRVHAHVALANRERVIGGHLEEGMKVINIAMVTVMELDGADLTDMDRYAVPDGAPLRRP